MIWDAVILTCKHVKWKESYDSELKRLKGRGFIPTDCLILTVADPESNVGSGGATMNALLHTVEHMSAKKGMTVLDSDALKNKRVLIVHDGRNFPFDPLGKTFLTLPRQKPSRFQDSVTNLELLISTLTNQVVCNPGPGVWVVSTDMILDIASPLDWSKFADDEVIAFTLPVSLDVAKQNGVYRLKDNFLDEIVYQGCDEEILSCSIPDYGLPVVCGLVFFSVSVAERLLGLCVLPPLDGCTYFGIDNGVTPVTVSLFFDLLASMCPGWSVDRCAQGRLRQDSTLLAALGGGGDKTTVLDVRTRARKVLATHLGHLRVRVALLNGRVSYPTWSGQAFMDLLGSLKKSISGDSSMADSHSSVSANAIYDPAQIRRSVLLNCVLENMRSDLVIEECILSGLTPSSAKALGTSGRLEKVCFVHFRIASTMNGGGEVLTSWGIGDDVTMCFEQDGSTFLGVPWNEFFQSRGITKTDLWGHGSADTQVQSLYTARLFPLVASDSSWEDMAVIYQWLWTGTDDSLLLNRWRQSTRMSLWNASASVDYAAEFSHRHWVYWRRCQQEVSVVLSLQDGLRDLFNWSVAEKRSLEVLNCLDDLLPLVQHSPGLVARLFASIADLLGCMACQEGGLRSGPAANPRWTHAFNLLEDGRLSEGSDAMCVARSNWLTQPELLIRCARHYEGAAQILIRQAVLTSRIFIDPPLEKRDSKMEVGPQCVHVECPARIDLSGGWSDTPPICYENGGMVITLALTFEARKPIGCRVLRINDPVIIIIQEDEDPLTIASQESLLEFNKPYLPGALVKACLTFVVSLQTSCDQSLCEQLTRTFGGGLRVTTWSNLPRGSGLGTSSILAGAVLMGLWRMAGRSPRHADIIYGVLNVEQMMTTGGGWQDQVGGIVGGANSATSAPQLPLAVAVETLTLDTAFAARLQQRLLLVYTGLTRLARNLLQEVVRNWYSKDAVIVTTAAQLVETAQRCRTALMTGDLDLLGSCLDAYWTQKRAIATGCEPDFVANLMTRLRPHCLGLSLTGAGGGGFLVAVLREGHVELARRCVEDFNKEQFLNLKLYDSEIDQEGIAVHEYATLEDMQKE